MQALFLGAGAPYECGLPLAVELSKELGLWLTPERIEAYNDVWREQGKGWGEKVKGQLLVLLADSTLNYEHLLGELQASYLAEQDERLKKDWYGARLFVLQTLYGLLLERQIKNYHYAKVALRDFKGIKALAAQNKPLWVFTSNQDCVVELLAAELFIPLKSGFWPGEELPVKGQQQPEQWFEFERLSTEQITRGCYDFFAPGEYGINLVKLNGSLDMFATDDTRNLIAPDYVKLASSSKTPDYYLQALLHLNRVNQELALAREGVTENLQLFMDGQGELQQWHKTLVSGIQPSGECADAAKSPMLKLFAEQLSEVESLFCVGYGFAAPSTNRCLKEWLGGSAERRMRIVNPGISAESSCLASLADYSEQIIHAGSKAGASDFFMSMDGNFGSLLQRIQRKIRNKARRKLMESLLKI